jgi:hypothetical protein
MILLHASPSIVALAVAIAHSAFQAGAEVDILAFFIGRYFGLQFYGAIYGTLLAFSRLVAAPVGSHWL